MRAILLFKDQSVSLSGKTADCINQAYMAVSLWKVSPLSSIMRTEIFTQESHMIGVNDNIGEALFSFIQKPQAHQRFNIPVGADKECGMGITKIVMGAISINHPFRSQQLFLQALEMTVSPLIVGMEII